MSPAPYYQDDAVTLYEGRCEDILPTLNPTGSVHLLTDPPYFQVKDDDWDNQWTKRAHFLDWMGEWLDLAKPLLTEDGSVWVFASPELTPEVEAVIAARFRLLNSVRWVKPTGDASRRNDITALRKFLSHWEGIVFAEHLSNAHHDADYEAHKAVFRPVGAYLERQRLAAGLTRRDLAPVLVDAGVYNSPQSATANVSLQEIGSSMLSAAAHAAWAQAVDLKPFEELQADYRAARTAFEAGRREYEKLRRPFTLTSRARSTDVFVFDNVAQYPEKHPCEKPLSLLVHMIETTTRPGDLILDPFTGSGAILDAARKTGRRAIGIEMDPKWCRGAAQRLGQQVLDFGDWDEEESA